MYFSENAIKKRSLDQLLELDQHEVIFQLTFYDDDMQPFFPRSLPIGWFAGTTGARCSPSPASCTAPVSGRRNVRTAYRAQVGTPYTAYSSNLSV